MHQCPRDHDVNVNPLMNLDLETLKFILSQHGSSTHDINSIVLSSHGYFLPSTTSDSPGVERSISEVKNRCMADKDESMKPASRAMKHSKESHHGLPALPANQRMPRTTKFKSRVLRQAYRQDLPYCQ